MYNFGLILMKLTECVEQAFSCLHLKYLNNQSMLKWLYLNGDILPVYIISHRYNSNTLNSLYFPVIIAQITLTNYTSYYKYSLEQYILNIYFMANL